MYGRTVPVKLDFPYLHEKMDERYPIGRFSMPDAITPEERQRCIEAIASHPTELRSALAGVTPAELGKQYRDGGWTIRQVVHHLADSHVNSYVRFKLALTEDQPQIKTYEEARWAELPDVERTSIEVSLQLLGALHERWSSLLRTIDDQQYQRRMSHPEWGLVTIDQVLALYAWHGAHHVAHVRNARARPGSSVGGDR